jgi:AcrR family transcriptional regulator
MTSRPYHHGDLRRALLAETANAVLESGAAHVSLRDVARRAGVSHAAPAHHFGDKAGLLAAMAAEGFRMLGDRLTTVLERTGSFLDVGVAYIEFAVEQRAYVEVMFRADLYDASNPEVVEARAAAAAALADGVATLPPSVVGADARLAGLAAWSLVHGFASLLIGGALPVPEDRSAATARAVTEFLFDPDRERDPVHGRDVDGA